MTVSHVLPGSVTEQVIDTSRYPLDEPDSAGWAAVVEQVRGELTSLGCCVLTDFVRPELQDRLRREGEAVAPLAYAHEQTVNVYNTDADPTLPEDHPARATVRRGNAFVARDLIPADFLVQRLYTSSSFQRFLAACFGLPEVHPLADPLSALCLNTVAPGRSHPWHFDTNEFTVSMLTREPDGGGAFEYCPGIRSARSENLADVRGVLDGERRLVRRLVLRPGDLQLFLGRYSLHRVTPVQGESARHSAIFAYSERPGVVGTVARTRQLFGRVTATHTAAAARAVRVDALMD